jgi:hypothetical protein
LNTMTLKVKPLASLEPGEAPDSNTLYTDSTGALVTTAGAGASVAAQAWEDAGYILSASGQLTSETQKRGSETRTRTWTYSTDASGNVTATAGAWE